MATRLQPEVSERRSFAPLVVVAALICLLPLAVLTYSTRRAAEHVVTEEVRRNVRTTASVSATLVAERVGGVVDLVESYATRPLVQSLFEQGPAGVEQARLVPLVDGLLATSGIRGVFVTDLDGRLTQVLPESPAVIGRDFSFRDWYRGLTSTGKTYVSEAYETAILGNPRVVAVATYVHDPEGGRLAILAVLYSLEAIDATSDRLADAQGVRLTLTDQRGVVLAAPGPTPARGLTRLDGDERVQRALAGRRGVIGSNTADGMVLAAYAPVEPLGWTVTAELPTRAALAPINAVSRDLLALSVIVALAILASLRLLLGALRRGRGMAHELLAEEARTREIIEAANDAFVGMDLEGRITDWNQSAAEMFGWAGEEVLGRRLSDVVVPPQHREAHEAGLVQYRSTGEGPVLGQRIEITGLRRDGREVPIELSIFVTEASGTSQFNAFIQDITTRQQKAADLAAARDQAIDASRMKSEFLANMSHEIRTPMNGVLGMTSLLLDSPLSREQRVFAVSVMSSGEALLDILNDILDFSKIEAGKLDIETIEFDLREIIEGSVELLAPRAQEKALEVAALVDPDVPAMVGGDPGRVRQVLTNLVGNAIKFTPQGEVVVRATVLGTSSDGLRVRVAVADTGIGIDEPTRVRLFEAFSQADSSTTRRYGGTGLGLAISKQLVELMGGEIGVESERGTGSTFWFELPFAHAHGDLRGLPVLVVDDDNLTNGAIRSQTPIMTRQLLPEAERPRILVAEDNDVSQRVAAGMLQRIGYRVDIVGNGEAAVAAVASGTYAAVLMDCQMPVMDGFEATRRIRSAETGASRTPIIALSASAMAGDADAAVAMGMDEYLTKPIAFEELEQALARWVPVEQREPALDPKKTAELESVGGSDFVAQLIGVFLASAPGRMEEMRLALDAGDAEAASRAAHTLRGGAANIGARALSEACATAESAAGAGDLVAAAAAVEVAKAELARVVAAGRALGA